MVKSAESESLGSVAPFLKKCYDMVDDESTDEIISWNNTNNSFVIWDMTQFSVQLLPKYFKHSNFSSFMRQLNIYGFRKVDTDSWIFANDGFVRDQKHLLKNISRKRTSQAPSEQQKPTETKEPVPENSPKKVQNDLRKEVENLKIDKNALTQELLKLRQHHESSKTNLLVLRERLQGMEKNQQQMLSFLVMAMQYPGYFVALLQSKENNWRVADTNMLEECLMDDANMASQGTIVRYQPPANETSTPMFMPKTVAEELPELKTYTNGMQDFFKNADFMKVLMDEKLNPLENNAPLILPEWTDDGSWEQFLLSSPFREPADDTKQDEDDEETADDRMNNETTSFETMLEKCQDFNYFDEMENSPCLGTAHESIALQSRNVDTLTQKMGRLASETENPHRL